MIAPDQRAAWPAQASMEPSPPAVGRSGGSGGSPPRTDTA